MENSISLCYSLWHETHRNRATVGNAASAGNPIVKSGQESAGSSSCSKFFRKFGVSMVSSISKRGTERIEVPTHSRPSAQAYQGTEEQACKGASERIPRRWVSDGSLDAQTCGQSDRPSVRYPVSSIPCLETSGKSGMELSEAGTSRSSARRKGNRPLEAVPMASYKKTRQNMEPIWYFLTKAAFYSSPRSGEHGHPRGKRRTCITTINETGYLPSAHSPYRRKEKELRCTFDTSPEILMASISEIFLLFCSSIFTGQSSCYGITHPFTTEKRSNGLLPAVRDCMLRTSRPMHRNSIRQNMFGIKPTQPLLTAHRKIWLNCAECCAVPSAGLSDHKSFFGPASMPQIYRGQDSYFHYLCKDQ